MLLHTLYPTDSDHTDLEQMTDHHNPPHSRFTKSYFRGVEKKKIDFSHTVGEDETPFYRAHENVQGINPLGSFLKAIGLALGNRRRWGREEGVTAIGGYRETEERTAEKE